MLPTATLAVSLVPRRTPSSRRTRSRSVSRSPPGRWAGPCTARRSSGHRGCRSARACADPAVLAVDLVAWGWAGRPGPSARSRWSRRRARRWRTRSSRPPASAGAVPARAVPAGAGPAGWWPGPSGWVSRPCPTGRGHRRLGGSGGSHRRRHLALVRARRDEAGRRERGGRDRHHRQRPGHHRARRPLVPAVRHDRPAHQARSPCRRTGSSISAQDSEANSRVSASSRVAGQNQSPGCRGVMRGERDHRHVPEVDPVRALADPARHRRAEHPAGHASRV